MAYEKQNFADGQVLTAQQLNYMEEGIVAAEKTAKEIIDDAAVGAQAWSGRNTVDKLCPSLLESGAVVVCNPVEGYPLGVVSKIVPFQEGSGEPSPDNVRPITGHSAVKLCHGNNAFIMEFGETVYGGNFDWSTGVLTVTHTSVVLDGVTTGKRMTTADGSAKTYVYVKALNGLPIKPGGVTYADRANCWVSQTSSIFFLGLSEDITGVTDEDNGSTVVSKFNAVLKSWYDAGTPLTVVFEMAEPYTVQLTPQKILALSGVNTLYSDTGDTEVTGKADPTAVIEKLTNAIIALGGNV